MWKFEHISLDVQDYGIVFISIQRRYKVFVKIRGVAVHPETHVIAHACAHTHAKSPAQAKYRPCQHRF